ncbi:hypothetical protein HI914_05285 [Erysiphe necator]|nr:hypothetical protein HI914_05285 [Erysiphe necator]
MKSLFKYIGKRLITRLDSLPRKLLCPIEEQSLSASKDFELQDKILPHLYWYQLASEKRKSEA